MLVKMKALTGTRTVLEVDPTYTIYQVKQQLACLTGIPVEDQCYIIGEKQLCDDLTVEQYGIKEGSEIVLVVALRGGYRFKMDPGNGAYML